MWQPGAVVAVDQFLNLGVAEAAAHWRWILRRSVLPPGKRRENFVRVEVATALALLFVVDPSTQGFGKYDDLAVQLSGLVRRPAGSLVEKGRNLNGVRPHGASGGGRCSASSWQTHRRRSASGP